MKKQLSVKTLAMCGMLAALVFVATSFLKLPVSITQGYIHLGDGVILLGAGLLGPASILASALGSMLADLLGGKGKPKPQTGGGGTGGEPITFAPVFNFYGSVTRKDAEEAGRISFAEFKRLYDRMRAEERRKSFSLT